jgi:lipoprotein
MTVISRRYLFAVTAVAATGTSSCGIFKNPRVQKFIKNAIEEIAATVGADFVLDLGEYVKDHLGEWKSYIESKVNEWVGEDAISDCDPSKMWTDDPDNPTIIVKEVYGPSSSCEANSDDSYCAIFFSGASDAILLPTWSLITLHDFVIEQCEDEEGADLNRIKQLLKKTLCPTSSHTEQYETPGNTVETVSWRTQDGQVEMAKIEKDDHTYEGMIKVDGYPDESNSWTVRRYSIS